MSYSKQVFKEKVLGAERYLLIIGIALLAYACTFFEYTLAFDRLLYDTFQKQTPQDVANEIVVIAVDERSLAELGRWPWPRKTHAELLTRLKEHQVRGVAFDIIFAEPDSEHPEHDKNFAQAIREHDNVVLPVFMQHAQRGGHVLEILPIPLLTQSPTVLGHVHVEIDTDGINRSVFLKEGLSNARWPHLSYALYNQLYVNDSKIPGLRPNTSEVQNEPSENFIIRNFYNLIPFAGPAGSIHTISYTDIIHNRVSVDRLSNKVVFVGATAAGLGDYIATPFGLVSGVEITANIYNALLQKAFIVPVDSFINALVSSLLALIVLFFLSKLSPKKLTISCFAACVVCLACSFILLIFTRLWLSPVGIIFAILLFYPLWNWRRLEIALSYLRQELRRVENEHPLIIKTHDIQQVINSLEFIHRIAPVKGWLLTSDSETLSAVGKVDLNINECKFSDKPVHSKYHSTAFLKLGQQIALLVVQWPQPSNSHQQKLIESLANEPLESELKDENTAYELVTGTIQQLASAKSKLDESKALLQKSLEQLTDGVILADTLGQIFFINNRAKKSFAGFESSLNLYELLNTLELSNNKAWDELLISCIKDNQAFSCEANNAAGNINLLCKGSLEKIQPGKSVVVITLTDVSELKESEKAREESLHFLSHDLRSPMISVLALIELANRQGEHTSSLPLLNDIGQYVERCLAYADSFLQLARAENEQHFNFEEINIPSLIENAIAHVYHLAQLKEIQLNYVNKLQSESSWLKGDRELLERALVNLLDNAIKHSKQNSQIIVTSSSDETHYFMSVRDFGQGIAEQDLAHLFEGFYKGSSHEDVPGIGLGLRFVSTVCKRHNGNVSVESKTGQGAVFSLSLPK